MKKTYARPQIYLEEFVPNQYIAACGNTSQTVDFTCLQGPNIDTANVLAEGSCSIGAKYISSSTVSKPSNTTYGYTRTNSTGGGWYVLCKTTDGTSYTTSEWQDDGIHKATHLGNEGSGGHGQGGHGQGGGGTQWHCMAAAVTNSVETVSFS